MGNIEKKANQILQNVPVVKKIVKRCYQVIMYMCSPKTKVEGRVQRITPKDDFEYFYGYYDTIPWDKTERYVLALRAHQTFKHVAPKEKAEIVLIDTKLNNKVEKIAETRAWNVQQGAMLQWVGPRYTDEILFNDYREGQYVSVRLNIHTMEEKVFSKPIYTMDKSGQFALSLDFARLHRLRPGYGYSWVKDETEQFEVPDSTALWKVDLESGESTPLVSYTDLLNFEKREEMLGAEHNVNHIMINPDGSRLMFLHRWVKKGVRYSRLLTMNTDGTGLYNLSDHKMVSHSCWKDNTTIISYLRKKEGTGYYLLTDQSREYKPVLAEVAAKGDGHPSVTIDGTKVVTDTYPNRSRVQSVYVSEINGMEFSGPKEVAKVFAPFRYDNEVRCDLHPRWNYSGNKICVDATFEGKRGMYVIDID